MQIITTTIILVGVTVGWDWEKRGKKEKLHTNIYLEKGNSKTR